MNCKECQEEIVELLAAGAAQLPREVSEHQRTCPICGRFYETQANLFRTMNASLQALANQSMPPSLLPGIRARLDQLPVTRRAWISSWSFAGIAVVAILAVSLSYVLRRPESHPNSSDNGTAVSRSVSNQVPAVQTARNPVTSPPPRTHGRASTAVPSLALSEPVPEVIVLAEERRAFAKFVAELPEERDVALALTRAASPSSDEPIEIALLQIESLDLKPFEGSEPQQQAKPAR
jgi:hypothetical protein